MLTTDYVLATETLSSRQSKFCEANKIQTGQDLLFVSEGYQIVGVFSKEVTLADMASALETAYEYGYDQAKSDSDYE
jgi:hypothetical protein